MVVTEGYGGPCPNCGHRVTFTRYGSGTYFRFEACPNCFFAYGQSDDTRDDTGGISTGADIWAKLLSRIPGVATFEDLQELAMEADVSSSSEPLFKWDEESESDEILMKACVPSLFTRHALEETYRNRTDEPTFSDTDT